MMKNTAKVSVTTEIVGWLGVGMIVAAYLLVSAEVVSGKDLSFQVLNLLGASGVVWVSYKKHIVQTIVLNLFWGTIALVTIISILVSR